MSTFVDTTPHFCYTQGEPLGSPFVICSPAGADLSHAPPLPAMDDLSFLLKFVEHAPQYGIVVVLWWLLKPILQRLTDLQDSLLKVVETSTEAHVKHASAIEDLRATIDSLPSRLYQADAYASVARRYADRNQ